MKKHFHKLKGFFVALLIGVAVMLPCFSVQASEQPYILLDSRRGLSNVISTINHESRKAGDFTFISSKDSGDGAVVRLNKDSYNNLDATSKTQLMTDTLHAIQKSSMSDKEKTRFYNFVSDEDTATSAVVRQLSTDVNADYATAWTWYKPFSGFTGTLLGFICICTVACLGLTIVVDISYLTLPFVQILLDDKTGGKPKFISNEAHTARQDAERDSTKYKDCLWMYFKRRAKSMAVLGVCIGYLLNGQIFMIVGRIMDLLSSVFMN